MKRNKYLSICFFSLFNLAGASAMAAGDAQLEPLYSAELNDQYIVFEAVSTGCTRAEDFTFLASGKGGEDFSTIAIRRDRPDKCRAAPRLIKVYLEIPATLVALKEPYKLDNLFVSKARFSATAASR